MTTSESVEESCRIVQDVYDERLAAANARVEELEARECLLTEALNQRDRANARAEAAEQRYCQAKSRASSEILVLDRACADYRQKLLRAESEAEALRARAAELAAAIDGLQALVSDASAQRDQAREMAGECSEKERAANARADALHARVAELERLNTNIRGAWISANNRALEANARVAELQAQNATLRESVDWERGLKDAFLPYQERAVRAEARVAELETPMAWKSERDAAIARADAAERRASDEERRARLESSRADIAEVHERELRALQLTHEAEAAALREQLASANALLAELKSDTSLVNSTRWWNRVHAHLSVQARREAKK